MGNETGELKPRTGTLYEVGYPTIIFTWFVVERYTNTPTRNGEHRDGRGTLLEEGTFTGESEHPGTDRLDLGKVSFLGSGRLDVGFGFNESPWVRCIRLGTGWTFIHSFLTTKD